MPGHAAVHANLVDFTINVIETGAVERTAEPTAQSLQANVGEAPWRRPKPPTTAETSLREMVFVI